MIFVSGANGNIGRQVVQKLVEKGARVRVGATKSEAATPRADGVEVVAFDYTRPETFKPALEGVTRLFLVSPMNPDLIRGEAAVVRAAKEAGVRHVVRSSVFAAGGGCTINKWHGGADEVVRGAGIPFTLLRPNSFMQNMINFFAATIKGQNAFYYPAQGARISHIDTRDIGLAAATVLTSEGHEGKAYDLTGTEALSFHDAAATLTRVLGRTISYVDPGPEAFRSSLLGYGMPAWVVDALVDYVRFCIEGGAAPVTDDFKKLTGKAPISYEQFVRDHAEQF
ncbi:SDR family oxidoreductase [Polyangium jinanense]|uniref:SDR family oxidoreductase n=1 Tax=Polyangium jinanense TaxID=2829994 RepID=UPI0023407574|nr:SDR family oxidoreductase [Polyangium jinanense]MDC3955144.1 SDR family oxidoreductase [Polyangium jinanense]